MAMRESTKRETLEMYELYKNGMSVNEIAPKFYVSAGTVYTRFWKMGLKSLRTERCKERALELHKLYMMGYTIAEISDRYSLEYDCVKGAFERYKLPKRGWRSRVAIKQDQMHEYWALREQGLSYSKIADRMGKSEWTVIRAFKTFGQRPHDDNSGDASAL